MTTLTIEIDERLEQKPRSLAELDNRTPADLIAEIVDDWVAESDWQVEGIRQAIEEADNGGVFYDNDDVIEYVPKLGNGERPPRPRPIERG